MSTVNAANMHTLLLRLTVTSQLEFSALCGVCMFSLFLKVSLASYHSAKNEIFCQK